LKSEQKENSQMKWSWKIGEFAGIRVYIHATFVLLLGWIAVSYLLQGYALLDALSSVGFMLALFACVVLHEFGHALTAKRFGIKTRDITLLPIGGVARLERIPDNPVHELWVALAGPAVNVAIGAALLAWLVLSRTLRPLSVLSVTDGPFLERLLLVNAVLVGFNMIPAFPMDGGRVLRALLAMRMEYTRATQVAASIGQGLAFVLGFIGLFANPLLIFTAFFVWIGAAQESRMVQIKASLAGIPVSQAMMTEFGTLSVEDTLVDAVELVRAGSQQDFPILEGGQIVGVLTRNDLLAALARLGEQARVVDVMRREFQVTDSHEMLEVALSRLQACACHTLPVIRAERLVGLLTMDNVGEFLRVQAALGAAAPSS
jgi:Zn-dependent protease/CBS domain-containing protein